MTPHPSSRLTAPQRLRLAVARLLGERTLLRLARWACPGEMEVAYVAVHRGLVGTWQWLYAQVCDGIDNERRKRRALARRRWARRSWSRLMAATERGRVVRGEVGARVNRGELVYAHGGKWWPSNRPAICPPGAEYGPSGACVLQPNPSGREPHNGEEEG